jgi:hypothetical protein
MIQKIPITEVLSVRAVAERSLAPYMNLRREKYAESFIGFKKTPAPADYAARYEVFFYAVNTGGTPFCYRASLVQAQEGDGEMFSVFGLVNCAVPCAGDFDAETLHALLRDLLVFIERHPFLPLKIYAVRFNSGTARTLTVHGVQPDMEATAFYKQFVFNCTVKERGRTCLFTANSTVGFYLCEGEGDQRLISYIFMPELGMVNGIVAADFLCAFGTESEDSTKALRPFARRIRLKSIKWS